MCQYMQVSRNTVLEYCLHKCCSPTPAAAAAAALAAAAAAAAEAAAARSTASASHLRHRACSSHTTPLSVQIARCNLVSQNHSLFFFFPTVESVWNLGIRLWNFFSLLETWNVELELEFSFIYSVLFVTTYKLQVLVSKLFITNRTTFLYI